MNLIRKYFALPPNDKKLFLLALGTSLVVKIVVSLLPLRFYSRFLRAKKLSPSAEGRHELQVRNVSRAVNRCSKYAPWPTRCLVDAITAKLLLRRAGLNSTLYLGVQKENEKLIAHAWLKCNDIFVTGRKGHQKFVVVSSF